MTNVVVFKALDCRGARFVPDGDCYRCIRGGVASDKLRYVQDSLYTPQQLGVLQKVA